MAEPSDKIALSRWSCELWRISNLLSIVHSRHGSSATQLAVGWSVHLQLLLHVFVSPGCDHLDEGPGREGVGTSAGPTELAACILHGQIVDLGVGSVCGLALPALP
jgi:hypothetical protein